MFVKSLDVRNEALRLVAAGVNDCEVSRRLGCATHHGARLASPELRTEGSRWEVSQVRQAFTRDRRRGGRLRGTAGAVPRRRAHRAACTGAASPALSRCQVSRGRRRGRGLAPTLFPGQRRSKGPVPRRDGGRASTCTAATSSASSHSTGQGRSTSARSCSSRGSAASSRRRRGRLSEDASVRTAASSSTGPAATSTSATASQPLVRHPRSVRDDVPRAWPATSPLRASDPPQPPRGRGTPARARRHEVLTREPLPLARPGGCGEIGRRAAFRSP